jgi:hypothetical protein
LLIEQSSNERRKINKHIKSQLAARRQKKKSRRTAGVFSHAYSYTAAFERSKPPFLLSSKVIRGFC